MKKIFLLAAAAVAMGITSCDIDDVENITEMSQSTFPATEEDAAAVLAGIYQNLNETHANPQCSYLYLACLASDDQLGGGGTNDKLMQAEDLMLSSGIDMTNQFYNDRYKGISRANVLINVLEDPKTDVQKQAKGEALALRAFYYYELASMYGNVPLVRNADEADAVQGDVKVLWGQILQDYRDAIGLMGSEVKHDGHLDKYAVEGLLTRAWLFYTGMYCNGTEIAQLTSTNYSPLTEVALPDGTTLTKADISTYINDAAKDRSKYDLVKNYRNLWAYTNSCTARDYEFASGCSWVENDCGQNIESMFAIKFNKQASWSTTIGYANGISLHFGVRGGQDYGNTFPFGQGWGAGPIAPNLVQDWIATEPADMRREAAVHNWDNSPAYEYNDDYVQATQFYCKKWSPITSKKTDGTYYCTFENEMFPGMWETSGVENFQLGNIHDLMLLRFADVLLMQSEIDESIDGINEVRRRAGLDEIKNYSLAVLQNERRWEFAGEGIRWNDMRRWHIAAAALEKQTDVDVVYCSIPDKNKRQGVGYAARYNATAGFAKMPETQVDLGVAKQNPGWDGSDSNYGGWAN